MLASVNLPGGIQVSPLCLFGTTVLPFVRIEKEVRKRRTPNADVLRRRRFARRRSAGVYARWPNVATHEIPAIWKGICGFNIPGSD